MENTVQYIDYRKLLLFQFKVGGLGCVDSSKDGGKYSWGIVSLILNIFQENIKREKNQHYLSRLRHQSFSRVGKRRGCYLKDDGSGTICHAAISQLLPDGRISNQMTKKSSKLILCTKNWGRNGHFKG